MPRLEMHLFFHENSLEILYISILCEFGTIMNHLNVRLRFEKNPLLDHLSGNWKINCIPINGFARTGDSLRESLRTKLLEIGLE